MSHGATSYPIRDKAPKKQTRNVLLFYLKQIIEWIKERDISWNEGVGIVFASTNCKEKEESAYYRLESNESVRIPFFFYRKQINEQKSRFNIEEQHSAKIQNSEDAVGVQEPLQYT